MFVKKQIKNLIKKKFTDQYDKLETDVNKFLKNTKIDETEFIKLRKILNEIDDSIANYKEKLSKPSEFSPFFHFQIKKMKESISDLRISSHGVFEAIRSIDELVLPFTFSSETTYFKILFPVLNNFEKIKTKLKNQQASFLEKFETPKKQYGDFTLNQESDTSTFVDKEKRESSAFSKPLLFDSDRRNSSMNGSLLKKPSLTFKQEKMLHLNSHDNYLKNQKSFSQMKILEKQANHNDCDVDLDGLKNIYDLSSAQNRSSIESSHKFERKVESKVQKDTFTPNKNTFVQRNQVNSESSRNFRENTKEVILKGINISADVASISNQKFDRQKFEELMSELRYIPRKVNTINFSSNIFKFNPISVFKSAFKEKLPFSIHFDMTSNKIQSIWSCSKLEIEYLKNINIFVYI